MMQNLIFNILLALVVAIAGIIAKTLLPYLKQKKEEAMAKLRATKWAWAADIIDAVVRAVQQTVEQDIHGEEKKQVAVKYIRDILNQAGIYLTEMEINTLIEAAVQTMNENNLQVLPEPLLKYEEGIIK